MKPFTSLAVVLFALIAIGHLARLLFGWPVSIAGRTVPMWPSAVGLVVSGLLAVFVWRENKR